MLAAGGVYIAGGLGTLRTPALRMPLALAWPTTGLPLSMAFHTITHSLNSFPLLAVPLFILVGNLLINTFIYKELTWSSLLDATRETIRTTSVLMIMLAAASLFTRVLALERVPQTAAEVLLSWSDDPLVLLLIVNLILILSGMFLESISALVLLTPVIAPPLVSAGVDPVHLGVVVVFTLMLGLLTPPMGISLFLVSDIAKVPVERILGDLVSFDG